MKKANVDEFLRVQSLISEMTGDKPMTKTRREQFQPTSGHCVYCGEWRVLTRDHFYPQLYLRTFLAGNNPAKWEVLQDTKINIVLACKRCQKMKGALHPQAWLRQMPKGWVEGKEFVRNKIDEIDRLTHPVTPTKETSVANYNTGPSRDWTVPMNKVLSAAIAGSRKLSAEEQQKHGDRYTHVYVGGITKLIPTNELDGASCGSVVDRLVELGVAEKIGKEQKYQGRQIWVLKAGQISSEDASRVDTLLRRKRREHNRQAAKQPIEPKVAAPTTPIPEVVLEEKKSGPKATVKAVDEFNKKREAEKTTTPAPRAEIPKGTPTTSEGYNQLLTEAKRLDGEVDRLRHRNEMLRDENQELRDQNERLSEDNQALSTRNGELGGEIAQAYQEIRELTDKLDALSVAGSPDAAGEITRLQEMVQTLLNGGPMAQMLQEAAKLGRST